MAKRLWLGLRVLMWNVVQGVVTTITMTTNSFYFIGKITWKAACRPVNVINAYSKFDRWKSKIYYGETRRFTCSHGFYYNPLRLIKSNI